MAAVSAVTPEVIAGEIRQLRKGHGLQARDLDRRIGPHLRELSGNRASSDVLDTREKLMAALSSRASALPADLRIAILAGLGLAEQTREMARFADRVSWLALHTDRQYRTALRRIDTAADAG